MIVQTPYSFEEFIDLPENRDRLFELINGEIVEKVPTEDHGGIAAIIVAAFVHYKQQHGISGHPAVEARHQLPEDEANAYLPDVSFRFTVEPRVKKGAVPTMPDIAVEIQSENDTLKKLRAKAAYYLQHGSRLVWLVLQNRTVKVRTQDGETTLTETDILDGGDVLPGFRLPVKDIFSS